MLLYEKYPVLVYNSLSNGKESLDPVNPGHIGMYVCGPTVYQDVHLGNLRTFLTFDIIYRYLKYLGYKVRYVRNITDVGHLVDDADEGEDKISKRARLEQLEPMQIVQKYTTDFHKVCDMFNLLPPDIEPTATGHLIEQIEHIKILLEKGLAYEVNGSVYFDVKKYNQQIPYGVLSGRNIEDLRESGRSLDSQDEKRDKIDFALWKKADPSHIMRWKSPWSDGFPGWHLECTVMSTKYLGGPFDIHGGGMDLKFPHHECEIAQWAGVTGEHPVRYWLHSNMLTVNGQKMSKSLGNSFLPRELVTGDHPLLERGYDPLVVRFFMLQSHYSSTLDFSNDALLAAEKGFKRLAQGAKNCKGLVRTSDGAFDAGLADTLQGLVSQCHVTMSDDFNTARTLAVLFEMTSRVNDFHEGKLLPSAVPSETWQDFTSTYISMVEEVLGLGGEVSTDNSRLEKAMEILIALRTEAKLARDYSRSDKIRDELSRIGIKLKDGKDGTSYTID